MSKMNAMNAGERGNERRAPSVQALFNILWIVLVGTFVILEI